ncbi:PPOX class F420-dependent oxidoreductase [Actinopolymorpha sp. NPDC004070]|uniref:PPOX class F420-dependent oxidoreductase n=1 Tax=Actinopolymorpha sp. NPDC004070 TaxID=3154548 RepID=UPI0033BBFB19
MAETSPSTVEAPLTRFARQRTVVLTTFRRDGTPVPTAVHVVVDGPHAYFRTYSAAGKAKRLRRDQRVEIAPSTAGGRPTGPATAATARLLSKAEAVPVRRLLRRKYPLLQGVAVPVFHRLARYHTLHYELSPRR